MNERLTDVLAVARAASPWPVSVERDAADGGELLLLRLHNTSDAGVEQAEEAVSRAVFSYCYQHNIRPSYAVDAVTPASATALVVDLDSPMASAARRYESRVAMAEGWYAFASVLSTFAKRIDSLHPAYTGLTEYACRPAFKDVADYLSARAFTVIVQPDAAQRWSTTEIFGETEILGPTRGALPEEPTPPPRNPNAALAA